MHRCRSYSSLEGWSPTIASWGLDGRAGGVCETTPQGPRLCDREFSRGRSFNLSRSAKRLSDVGVTAIGLVDQRFFTRKRRRPRRRLRQRRIGNRRSAYNLLLCPKLGEATLI